MCYQSALQPARYITAKRCATESSSCLLSAYSQYFRPAAAEISALIPLLSAGQSTAAPDMTFHCCFYLGFIRKMEQLIDLQNLIQ